MRNNIFLGIVIAVGAFALLFLLIRRKTRDGSVLARHYRDLEDRAAIGAVSNAMTYVSQPPSAMLGEGWATAARANITNPNPAYNSPRAVRFGFRYPQPKG